MDTHFMSNITPFDADGDPTSALLRCKKWIAKFDIFLLAVKITDKKQQRTMLLHFPGDRVYDIFETLIATGEDYEAAKAAVTTYFEPTKNVDYAIYMF